MKRINSHCRRHIQRSGGARLDVDRRVLEGVGESSGERGGKDWVYTLSLVASSAVSMNPTDLRTSPRGQVHSIPVGTAADRRRMCPTRYDQFALRAPSTRVPAYTLGGTRG